MSAGDFTLPGTTPARLAANAAYLADPMHFPPPSHVGAEETMRIAMAAAIWQADLSSAVQAKWLEFVENGLARPIEEFCDEIARAVQEELLR